MRYEGSCLCGQTRYECEAEPVFQFNCHCRDCQRSTGAGYAPILFFPREALRIIGELRYYESPGASGQCVARGFCPSCGAQMIGAPAVVPKLLSIRAGTLDDPTLYRPTSNVYTSQAAPWSCMDPALAQYEMLPLPKRG